MLETNPGVLIQVFHIIETLRIVFVPQQPADVGIPKPLVNPVRVLVLVLKTVMDAVFAGPPADRALKRGPSEDQEKNLEGPFGLVALMGEEAVVPSGDTESREDRHENGKNPRGPMGTPVLINPDEPTHRGQGGEGEYSDMWPVIAFDIEESFAHFIPLEIKSV